MKRVILLNPGPVTLSDRVRQAMAGPDLCHREPEFAALQASIRRQLLGVYALDDPQWAAILLTGSGTLAVEAMIASCIPRGSRLLVMVNGVYGERIAAMAERHEIPLVVAPGDWQSGIDSDAARALLDQYPDIRHLAVVQHETTTGRLNRLDELAALCRARRVELLVDAVSSFGAEEINFRDWPIAACAASANKCLHGVPGAAFVLVRRSVLEAAGQSARSLYLDLGLYLKSQDAGGTPFTQSVQAFYALDAALEEFFREGGWQQRQALYRQRQSRIRATLEACGVRGLLATEDSSCVLHAFWLPGQVGYQALHDALKSRGFIIYAGQGRLSEAVFRVSLMGDIQEPDLLRLERAFSETLSPLA